MVYFFSLTKFPEIPGIHFIDLGRMKGWVNLGATQWSSTQDPKIGNPAPQPLSHCSIKLVNVFVAWKDKKFQKTYKLPSKTNFNRLLLDLLKIKLNCSYLNYVIYHFFYQASNKQNIPMLEQVFNKGKNKNIAGLPQQILRPQLTLVY